MKSPLRTEFLLTATAVFAWLAVGVLGLSNTIRAGVFPWAAALWLGFGLVMGGHLRWGWLRPEAYFSLQTALVAALLFVGNTWSPFPILFFLLSAEAVLSFPLRRALAWVAAFVAVTFSALAWQAGWRAAFIGTPTYAAGYLFFLAFGYALRQAQQSRTEAQRLLRELQAAHRRLQAYAEQSAALAVAEERNRVAQEMHDTLGHHLTVAAVQLEAAQSLASTDPERAARIIATAREQVRRSLSELRRTVAALRPEVDDLPAALTALAQRFAAATGLHIAVHCDPQARNLPPSVRLMLYRAAQEGLTNIQRHAHARHATLTLSREPHAVVLTLDDDGVGPPPVPFTTEGLGLRGMAAQAARLGGTATLRPRPQGGARLEVHVPLPPRGATPASRPPFDREGDPW